MLPYELVNIIYEYIPKSVSMFLTKVNYMKDHHLIRKYINKNNIETYIRAMIQRDNDFVFKYLLVENFERWINMSRYYYKECIYSNYLYFLQDYAMENESIKCRELILSRKNQHKKKILKYIKWNS